MSLRLSFATLPTAVSVAKMKCNIGYSLILGHEKLDDHFEFDFVQKMNSLALHEGHIL